jgi:hypothetical protein
MPKLFIVATIFIPTYALFPTPHIISLLRVPHEATIASTALKKPALAVGSVWYNRETKDRAVASVVKT